MGAPLPWWLGLRPLLVEDVAVQGLVLRLSSKSQLVLSSLHGVLHTRLRCLDHGGELLTVRLLVFGDGSGTRAVLHGVLGFAAVRKAHGRVLANLAADVLDRILISNFSHDSLAFRG